MSQKVTVAAAHLAPVYLDTQATVDKVCAYILEAANAGVQLIAFPESFIPGFPVWPAVSPPIYNHNLFSTFASQSLHVPGPEILKICTVEFHRNRKIWSYRLANGSDYLQQGTCAVFKRAAIVVGA